MEITISELTDFVKPGETVLVEYSTSYVPEFTLKLLADYTRENGVPFLIDEYFDSLYTVVIHAEMLGMEINLDHARVIKIGGKKRIGGAVKEINFHPDPRVLLKNYGEVFIQEITAFQEPAINLILGIEATLHFVRDVRDFYRFLLGLQKYVGNPKRKAFYMIYKDFFDNLPPYVHPELRRIATSVWELKSYPTGVKIHVLKSPNTKILRREFTLDVGGVIGEQQP